MATNFAGYRALGNVNPATGAFTEITGGGYARQAVTLVLDGNGRITNSADISYGPATGAAWPKFSAVAVFDALTVGNLVLWYETNMPQTIAVGVSHLVPAGKMNMTFPASAFTVHGTPVHLGKDVIVSGKSILVNGV